MSKDEKIVTCDHIFVKYDMFDGKAIREYSLKERKIILKLIKNSILKMNPAPNPSDIYVGDCGIDVLWYLPTPVFLNNENDVNMFDENVIRFLETNPLVMGSYSMSTQSYNLSDLKAEEPWVEKSYWFYKNLGIKLVVEPIE